MKRFYVLILVGMIVGVFSATTLGQAPIVVTITLDPNLEAPYITVSPDSIQASPGDAVVWVIENRFNTPKIVSLQNFMQGTAADCSQASTPSNPMRKSDLRDNVPRHDGTYPGYGSIAAGIVSSATDCYKYEVRSGNDVLDPEIVMM